MVRLVPHGDGRTSSLRLPSILFLVCESLTITASITVPPCPTIPSLSSLWIRLEVFRTSRRALFFRTPPLSVQFCSTCSTLSSTVTSLLLDTPPEVRSPTRLTQVVWSDFSMSHSSTPPPTSPPVPGTVLPGTSVCRLDLSHPLSL